MKHDELAENLRETREQVGEVAVTKLALGPWGDAGEMDVFAIRTSRTKPLPTCYEVKVSRADFLADLRSEKFRRYEPWCARGYFAVLDGVASRSDVPDGWGLLVYGRTGWHSVKAARVRPMLPERAAKVYLATHLRQSEKPWAPHRATRLTMMAANPELRAAGVAAGQHVSKMVDELRRLRAEVACLRAMTRDKGVA